MRQTPTLRVGPLWILLLLASSGIVGGTLTGCNLVADQLTGIELSRRGPTGCIQECNEEYKLLFAEEQSRHLTEIEECLALPPEEKGACLEAEAARHEEAMLSLGEGKIECQDGCHRQGTVRGG